MTEEEFSISYEDNRAQHAIIIYLSHRPTGLSQKFVLSQHMLQDDIVSMVIEHYVRMFVETVDRAYPKIEVKLAPPIVDDWSSVTVVPSYGPTWTVPTTTAPTFTITTTATTGGAVYAPMWTTDKGTSV